MIFWVLLAVAAILIVVSVFIGWPVLIVGELLLLSLVVHNGRLR